MGSKILLRRKSEIFTAGDQIPYLHVKLLLKGVSAFMKYLKETPESIRMTPESIRMRPNTSF